MGVRLLVICCCLFLLSACYEGWENPNGDGTGNGDTDLPTTPTIPEDPLFFYILVHFIVPSSDAIADADCIPNQGIATYRETEWTLRRAAIVQSLTPLTARIQQIETPIGADDCQTLAALDNASLDSAPWSPEDAPGDDSLDRFLIHLKVVLWDEDASATPSTIVTQTDWLAWDDLRAAGRRTFSGHHFIVTSDFEGYFGDWAAVLPAANVLTSEGIPTASIDPSPDGLESRNTTISTQTTNLVEWLVQATADPVADDDGLDEDES